MKDPENVNNGWWWAGYPSNSFLQQWVYCHESQPTFHHFQFITTFYYQPLHHHVSSQHIYHLPTSSLPCQYCSNNVNNLSHVHCPHLTCFHILLTSTPIVSNICKVLTTLQRLKKTKTYFLNLWNAGDQSRNWRPRMRQVLRAGPATPSTTAGDAILIGKPIARCSPIVGPGSAETPSEAETANSTSSRRTPTIPRTLARARLDTLSFKRIRCGSYSIGTWT